MRQLFTKLMLTSIGCLAAYSYGQTIVSTEPQNKKAILEEFTGVNCQYCPDGHAIAEQILNNNPGNAFAINIHSGGYAIPSGSQPDFRTQWEQPSMDKQELQDILQVQSIDMFFQVGV